MFTLLKLIIWLAGFSLVAYFLLPFVGYEVNLHYWSERKSVCQEKLNQCRKDLLKSGIEGAKEKCDFQCVETDLLIRKK